MIHGRLFLKKNQIVLKGFRDLLRILYNQGKKDPKGHGTTIAVAWFGTLKNL